MTWKAWAVLVGLVLGAGSVSAQQVTIFPPFMAKPQLAQVVQRWKARVTQPGVLCAFGSLVKTVSKEFGPQGYIRVDSMVRVDSLQHCSKKVIGVLALGERRMAEDPRIFAMMQELLAQNPHLLFLGVVYATGISVRLDEELLETPWVALVLKPSLVEPTRGS